MKKYLFILSIAILTTLVLTTCKKEAETPSGTNKIEIGQTLTDSVSYYYAELSTTLTDLNGNQIKEHGHCWSTTEKPTIEDHKSQLGKLTQATTFSSELYDLEDNTAYYCRYYLSLDNGTVYGSDMNFSTLKASIPEVETSSVSNITLSTATVQGVVIADSGAIIQSKGFCWHTQEDFNIDNCIDTTQNGAGLGAFSAQISALTEGTNYYVKAYAINDKGISYGGIEGFITVAISIPSVSTLNVENITNNQAIINAEVLNNGLGTISARGVCWHTLADFDINNNSGLNNEAGALGGFSSTLTELNENTSYFAKAFATNEKGTAYGEVIEFLTSPITIPEISTAEISGITINAANGGGTVTSEGYSDVSDRGIVWSTAENPTTENNEGLTTDGQGLGEFNSNLTNLTDGTIYYVRAYAINEIGTAYGTQKTFQTIGIGFPVLTTNNVTNITENSAQSGGNITDAGNGSILTRGICWNTTGNPTLENNINFTTNGTGIGSFTAQLTSLSEGVQYYVAAYATNEEGISYGSVKSFTTTDLSAPTVTTANASNITESSATAGGNVTDDGNLSVIQRGVCWHTNPNPSMSNNLGYTTDGTGTGNFVSSINGLNEGISYYFRAYAINSEGTAYGTIKEFTTLNLELPTVSTNNISNIGTTYATGGGNVISDGNSSVTARGVCWNTTGNPTLSNSIGNTNDGSGLGSFTSSITGLDEGTTYYVAAYATNSEGTAYGSTKSFNTTALSLPTITTTEPSDITENSAQSGGNVTDDGNATVTARGVCWNTTGNPTLSNSIGNTSDGSGLGSFTSNITGLDDGTTYYVAAYATNSEGTAYGSTKSFTTTALSLPTITTTEPINITESSAQSGGNVIDDGNATVSARGVCWNTTGNPTLSNSIGNTSNGSGLGSFTSNITGLDESTTYYVAAYATNSVGTSYGSQYSFMTEYEFGEPCPGMPTVTYEGQVYSTVLIGEQCWFRENLNIGIRINGSQVMQDNSIIEKYCFDDDESNCDIYGGLYSWDEMMQYTTQEGVQGICPNGWHIPTDNDWTVLIDLLGGEDIAGGKMKETGTVHWNSPNTGATNSSGFTALPGGYRVNNGSFHDLGSSGLWWSSTDEDSSSHAWYQYLYFDSDQVYPNPNYKTYGFSVRCLKD